MGAHESGGVVRTLCKGAHDSGDVVRTICFLFCLLACRPLHMLPAFDFGDVAKRVVTEQMLATMREAMRRC